VIGPAAVLRDREAWIRMATGAAGKGHAGAAQASGR